jgi:hypothetical protein
MSVFIVLSLPANLQFCLKIIEKLISFTKKIIKIYQTWRTGPGTASNCGRCSWHSQSRAIDTRTAF